MTLRDLLIYAAFLCLTPTRSVTFRFFAHTIAKRQWSRYDAILPVKEVEQVAQVEATSGVVR